MSTKERVVAILREIKPTKDLEQVKDIVEGGYIDSFELLMLISALSERFGIEISVDDITPENFNSIDAISMMIDRIME